MKDFILPDIGEGIVECELLKWLVAEGDTVVEDQPVAEVMTDKATVEIPAMHNGVVSKLYYKEGDIAKVHAPLFAMTSHDEANNDDSLKVKDAGLQASSDVSTVANEKVESFVLPDIGEGIVECEVMLWHIQEGDTVTEDQVVVEVMTDKAVVEIPAKYDGKILKLHYQKGDIAKVHTPLFDQVIAGQGSKVKEQQDKGHSQSVVTVNTDTPIAAPNKQAQVSSNEPVLSDKQGGQFEAPVAVGRAIASPAVRRLARELNIALTNVNGSGKKGRVLKQDILNANVQASQTSETHGGSAQTLTATKDTVVADNVDRVEAVKGVRAAMAKQMMSSVSTIPHFTVSDEVNMDKLIALRSLLKPDFEKSGLKLSFMPFFIKALSLALHAFPIINSRLNEQGTELTYLSSHNIGIAIDGKLGLMVPNIKDVQNKSLFDVTKELNRLIDAARDGKLSNTDLSKGSISISNIGALGGITATPVINKPEVAIVALGKTQRIPRFDDNGDVYAANIMMVNWSGDHRVIDGATMVKFNNLWMDYVSQPEKMMMHLR